MNDDKMAKEYNIEGGSVLHLVSPSVAYLHYGEILNTQVRLLF